MNIKKYPFILVNIFFVLGLVVVGFFTLAPTAQAATINASSCSSADVQAAINSAATGDTVLVPAGNCAWTTGITVSGKNIILQGAGKNSTVVTISGPSRGISLLGTAGSRVTGFGFVMASGGSAFIYVEGQNFRVDNSKFDNRTGSGRFGVDAEGCEPCGIPHPTGVVDHNEFINANVIVLGDRDLLAHTIWSEPSTIANSNQTGVVYIEDNTFNYTVFGNVIDANAGGRYVFRHNTVTNVYAEAHSVQGNHRASRSWELYNNSFITTSERFTAMFLRGGTGVVFNNTLTGSFNNSTILDNVRSSGSFGFPPGVCNGNSSWDGNQTNGWPCRDQIGRGQDSAGTFPQAQASEPAYFWNNTLNGNTTVPEISNCGNTIKTNGSCADIVEGRDYIVNNPKPGYVSYTYPHPFTTAGFTSGGSQLSTPPPISPTPVPTSPLTPSPSSSLSGYNFGTITLRLGSTGEAVKELQRFLNQFLNLGLVVDGKLGPKTIAVVKKWQSYNGLVVDGLVGPKTKARMQAMGR